MGLEPPGEPSRGERQEETEVDFDFDFGDLDLDGVDLSPGDFRNEISGEPGTSEPDPEPSERHTGEGHDEDSEEPAEEPAEEPTEEPAEESEQDVVEPDPALAGNWRALFERELRALEVDARVEMARHASDERLNAFCYDPSPRVISALLENQRFGLAHARLVASHHLTGAGLDLLCRHQVFARDRKVQRSLFRNSTTPQGLMLRIFQTFRLAETFRWTVGRESTDRVRSVAKKQFRTKFPQTSAEERVQLILKTEGRCLPQLVGVALGGRATALLCRRPLVSTLLIRNLARWPSTPPPVLQHMARQPAVRRSPMLRNEILRHPNAPSRLQNDLQS